MTTLLEYKGYQGTVEYTDEDNVYFGEVLGIRGLISYEAENEADLKRSFRETIDSYLSSCEEEGRMPMRPYCGVLSDIRISPNIHEKIYSFAISRSKSPGQVVEEALHQYLTA